MPKWHWRSGMMGSEGAAAALVKYVALAAMLICFVVAAEREAGKLYPFLAGLLFAFLALMAQISELTHTTKRRRRK